MDVLETGWNLDVAKRQMLKVKRFAELESELDEDGLAAMCQSGECPAGTAMVCPFAGRECEDVDAYDWGGVLRRTLSRTKKGGSMPYFLPRELVILIRDASAAAADAAKSAAGSDPARTRQKAAELETTVCRRLQQVLESVEAYSPLDAFFPENEGGAE